MAGPAAAPAKTTASPDVAAPTRTTRRHTDGRLDFLAALMVLAGGITLLQVAANPYVAVLGKPETASSRLNLTQAFNSFGTFIGPYIGGYLILNANAQTQAQLDKLNSGALQAYRVQEAASVKMPYLGIAAFLFVFAIIIGLFKLPAMLGSRGGDA